jgi:SPP1 gp7 family putative phage head morphogenesis protein
MTRGALYGAAVDAADELLQHVYRLDVAKALDPLDARDFLVIIQRLSRALTGVSREAETDALRRALATLDVDWPNLSPRARDEVVRAARQTVAGIAGKVMPHIDQVFEVESKRVVSATRRSAVRRFGLRIGSSTTRTDERIAAFVRESEANFIRDQYGKRADELSQRARSIVAAGLERGLGRNDIAGDLSSALGAAAGRRKAYWEVVATSFANRGRTYTQLATFQGAAVERYRFEAVLDEVTSEACRFLHGRVFSVQRAMQRFADVERAREPEAIADLQPWVQLGADERGNQVLFYRRAGRRHVVAQVDEPAVGNADRIGRYSRALAPAQLQAAGLTTPPLHGRCRSTLVPEG